MEIMDPDLEAMTQVRRSRAALASLSEPPSQAQPQITPANLPLAEKWELVEACRQLSDNQARKVLATRLLPFVIMPGKILYAAAGQVAFKAARRINAEIVSVAHPDDMLAALQQVFGPQILVNARDHLATQRPALSAARRLTLAQGIMLAVFACVIAMGVWQFPDRLALAFSAAFSIIFLSVVGMRLAAIMALGPSRAPQAGLLPDEALPVYTVLVPLFRETEIVEQLLVALSRLSYPVDKLDIKLILEQQDSQTLKALAQYDLPPWFETIIVPHAAPQTKPKALNYALQFARGAYAVIFDAEDIPEPDQLRRAASAFHHAPDDLVCLQASLTYYNANENWLTRQFTIEYAVLFDIVLPFLGGFGLPLPLGGTSNHFRMSALAKMGGWDPYNVTEDADLGLRLARFGWRADTLNSATFEEANNELKNWISQRARWIKGWIQTWFVHMRNPARLVSQLGLAGFLSTQIIVAGIVLSTLAHPFFLTVVIWQIVTGSFLPLDVDWPQTLLAGIGLAVLLSGYGVMMLAGWRALSLRGLAKLRWQVLAMPAYWILMSLGGWLAVWQFITQPFHWNKTRHGLSRVKPYRRPQAPR